MGFKKVTKKITVEAFKIEDDSYKDLDCVHMSKGWTPSGTHHDRFIEEPEEPTPYIIDESRNKVYMRNPIGGYILKFTDPESDMIWYDYITNFTFHTIFKYE